MRTLLAIRKRSIINLFTTVVFLVVWLTIPPALGRMAATRYWYSLDVSTDFVQQARLVSGNSNDNYASYGIGISGDTAVIASNVGVYVHVRTGTTWSQQALLVPSDGLSGFLLPPVAIEGNTVVISAYRATINGNVNQGAAYVFVRNGTTWSQQQRLTAGTAESRFGRSLAISGDTLLIGASATVAEGTAYVYVRNAGVWTEQTTLRASDGAGGNGFGILTRVEGNTAVVRTPRTAVDPAVYVFVRNGETWQQQQKLSICEPSGNGLCEFGSDIAVNNDTLAV